MFCNSSILTDFILDSRHLVVTTDIIKEMLGIPNYHIRRIFMKKIISLVLSVLLIGCTLTSCGISKSAEPVYSDSMVQVISPAADADIHSKKQESFLDKSNSLILVYARGSKELSIPEPVKFEWVYNGGQAVDNYVLNISQSKDMTDSVSYTTSDNSYSLYNLKIDTTYYWTVSVGDQTSSVFEFTTCDSAPRNIYVDGVTNVRDLGGWKTEDGSRTKQGLIYRCGRLNESSSDSVNIEITDAGKKTMLETLGIKSEIDLRKTEGNEIGSITSSPLGDTVNYFNCPMDWDGNMFENNKEQIKNVFSILSDKNNYPIIFHCNIGTDRTGMIAFLVNALLGVQEDDLFRDYLYSNFGNIGNSRSISGLKKCGYYDAIQASAGDSLSEKTYNCLVNIGIPKEQIDSVISILGD